MLSTYGLGVSTLSVYGFLPDVEGLLFTRYTTVVATTYICNSSQSTITTKKVAPVITIRVNPPTTTDSCT